jgi:hypothetical protein
MLRSARTDRKAERDLSAIRTAIAAINGDRGGSRLECRISDALTCMTRLSI